MRTGMAELQPTGFVLAALGFALTRFVVVDALTVDAAVPFLVAGSIPLVAGLGLTVFGVVIAVGSFTTTYVRTVTLWALVGTLAMLGVLGVTSIESTLQGEGVMAQLDGAGVLIANVLVGGAIGGTITGDRAATNNSQRRRIQRQADRGIVINRILRHEVLNAAAIVKGYADLLDDQSNEEAVTAIRDEAARIDRTINEVGQLAEPQDRSTVDVIEVVDEVKAEYSDSVRFDIPAQPVVVLADDRLGRVVRELVDNAVTHGANADARPLVRVNATKTTARIQIEDDGPGLPDEQRAVLTDGALPEFDDPSAGFGLQIAGLLVDQYGGSIDVTVDGGTTITVTLPRAIDADTPTSRAGIPNREVLPIAGVSVVAALAMGLYLQFAIDLLPVIGSLYGVENPTVGWITHGFHSIVFGLLYAAGRESPLLGTYADRVFAAIGTVRPPGYGIVLGILWGLILAVLAAGFVMPTWLTLVGEPATFPNLTVPGLISHVVWGAVLGTGYWVVEKRLWS